MSIEVPQVSAELVNQGFVDKVFSGQIKEAQEQASMYIRLKLYEDGILRRLFDNRLVTADELDPIVSEEATSTDPATNDQPSIICELEPDATEATFVPFKGTGTHKYFHGKRFRVPFGKIEAERISKNKFELMTIRMPITEWLKENQVKAIQQQEDETFMGLINEIISKEAVEHSTDPQQSLTVSLGSSTTFKDAFVKGLQMITRLRLPEGKVLMHKNTYWDSLKLKTEDIGFRPQEERFGRGIDGEDTFLGRQIITTIKDDIVKENELYFFVPQEYFCKFFLLQDSTLFMKTEADMMTFYTYEAPGMGIGNTKGVVKITLA